MNTSPGLQKIFALRLSFPQDFSHIGTAYGNSPYQFQPAGPCEIDLYLAAFAKNMNMSRFVVI